MFNYIKVKFSNDLLKYLINLIFNLYIFFTVIFHLLLINLTNQRKWSPEKTFKAYSTKSSSVSVTPMVRNHFRPKNPPKLDCV